MQWYRTQRRYRVRKPACIVGFFKIYVQLTLMRSDIDFLNLIDRCFSNWDNTLSLLLQFFSLKIFDMPLSALRAVKSEANASGGQDRLRPSRPLFTPKGGAS
jgi:hypothetical protein